MSLYTDIRDDVFVWTNRPYLAADTDIAILQALRAAHRAALFWRDIVEVDLPAQAVQTVQQIDIAANTTRFKQVAYIKPTGVDKHYKPVDITDLMDDYQAYKLDVFYGMGQYLMIRAAVPVADLTLAYYQAPLVTPIENIDSWIAEYHQDLIVLWAASTILGFVGEQEIKGRVDGMAGLARTNLIAEALQIQGR